MRRLKSLYTWFDSRLQLGEPIKEMALHPVPNKTASWWYVFGSAAFVLLMLQFVTGILLALVYVPSAGQAWNSLNVLNHQLTLGWFLRAMHGWGSNFMVAVVLIHMAQVFLYRLYCLWRFGDVMRVLGSDSNRGCIVVVRSLSCRSSKEWREHVHQLTRPPCDSVAAIS
jgi:quinol-cytochrome oxidoreductase complex cytochrome b subunit